VTPPGVRLKQEADRLERGSSKLRAGTRSRTDPPVAPHHGHTIPDGRFSNQKNGFRWRHVFHFTVTASTVCRSISDARPPAAGGRAICGHGLLLPSPAAHAILLQLMPAPGVSRLGPGDSARPADRQTGLRAVSPGIFPSGCHSLADNASPTPP